LDESLSSVPVSQYRVLGDTVLKQDYDRFQVIMQKKPAERLDSDINTIIDVRLLAPDLFSSAVLPFVLAFSQHLFPLLPLLQMCRHHAFFVHLPLDIIRTICKYLHMIHPLQGETIYKQGDKATRFYLVSNGRQSETVLLFLLPLSPLFFSLCAFLELGVRSLCRFRHSVRSRACRISRLFFLLSFLFIVIIVIVIRCLVVVLFKHSCSLFVLQPLGFDFSFLLFFVG
jgi:hypothetical protein